MNRTRITGTLLTLVGLVGYGLGVTTAFPGRAFTVTAVMIGIALYAVGTPASEVDA